MRFSEYCLSGSEIKLFHSTVSSGKRLYFEHHHTECELSVIISGTGIYKTDNAEYHFKKNDVFLFASNENHCITDIGSIDYFNILNIHFEPRALWSYGSFGGFGLLKIFYSRTKAFTNQIQPDNPSTDAVRALIFAAEKEFIMQKPEYELMVKMNIANALIILIRDYGYVLPDKEPFQGETLIRLEKALDYINSNLEEKITLDTLSKISAMNKTYFSTMFKKYNGITPWDYITIKRVEKAIALIQSSDLCKLEIASLCGFSSPSNFYKAFRAVTGKAPGDYVDSSKTHIL